MPIKVSVVVPVYNPGKYLSPLIDSLNRQSLPSSEFEAVFVDDGSTDGTADRLDELAAANENFRVIHTPNSGWPGRPRNIGIEAAVGEYVQFVDNDDWLGDEALERLYAYAVANNADVVVGKEARPGMRWSMWPLFDHNRPHATLGEDPLLGLLSPHKMFRRTFLNEHDLRFPDGPRRLEDHPFVVRAYFLAEVISVLADYPCYYWLKRADQTNAGARPREWRSWYGNLTDALDVVTANTEPGGYRDRLLSHWFWSKGLRLLGAGLSKRTAADARELFDALAELTARSFPPGVDAYVPHLGRIRAALLRAGEFDRLMQLSELEAGMHLRQEVDPVQVEGGSLVVTVQVRLAYPDGSPVLLDAVDGRAWWRCPIELGPSVDPQLFDFTDLAGAVQARMVASTGDSGHAVELPATLDRPVTPATGRVPLQARLQVRLGADLEQQVAGPSGFDPGRYALHLRLGTGGWSARARLASPIDLANGIPVREPVRTPLSALALITQSDNLELRVQDRRPTRGRQRAGIRVDPLASYARRHDDALQVVLRLARPKASGTPVWVRLTPSAQAREGGARRVQLAAGVDQVDGAIVIDADVPATRLRPGTWELAVRFDGAKYRRVRARLLLGQRAHQPVALLPDM